MSKGDCIRVCLTDRFISYDAATKLVSTPFRRTPSILTGSRRFITVTSSFRHWLFTGCATNAPFLAFAHIDICGHRKSGADIDRPILFLMPLGTVVRDVYSDGERAVVYAALQMLTRGNDWSRSGVYCFWDPSNGEALYIGLASHLPDRFAQHNSLKGMRPRKGNKGKEISAWFGAHQRLGFSIVLQEALADEEYEPYARNAEGQLLEGYRRFHGRLPPWNNMGGSTRGAEFVRHNSVWWIDAMTGANDSPVVARRTVRSLSEDASAEYFENCIHMARTQLANFDGASDEQISAAIGRAIEWRAGPPLFDSELAQRLRDYFSQPAPHPERI